MRKLFAILSVVLSFGQVFGPSSGYADDDVIIVELFTSQGCSSCPPADATLARLTQTDGVLAMSFHVDYWDYLGWRDTFGSKDNTNRQFKYREHFGARVVYTPQMVIQGSREAPGYRESLIRAAISEIAAAQRPAQIAIVSDPRSVSAKISTTDTSPDATIWMAAYRKTATIDIKRGENAGRTITYHNVVEKLMHVGMITAGSSRNIDLPQPNDGSGIAVWLQDDRSGKILTASFLER